MIHVLEVSHNLPKEAQKRGYDEDVQIAVGGARRDSSPYIVTVKLIHHWHTVDREIEKGALVPLYEPNYREAPTVLAIEVRRRDGRSVSARDVKRLPLTTAVSAAVAAVSVPLEERTAGDWLKRVKRASSTRSLPKDGKMGGFYEQFAQDWRAYAAQGKSPAKEIARQRGVPENRVHQWAYRARHHGNPPPLEPSPRSKIQADRGKHRG